LWRSEIHINEKIDVEDLNQRWRRFCVRRIVYRIYEGSMLVSAHAFTVYAMRGMKSKTKQTLPNVLPI